MKLSSLWGVELVAAHFWIVNNVDIVGVVHTPQHEFSDTGHKTMLKKHVGEMAAQDLVGLAVLVVVFGSPIHGGFFFDILGDEFVGLSMTVEDLYEILVDIQSPFFVGGEKWLD